MHSPLTDPYHHAQQDLASWHSTHPDATLAEIETAVEEQIARLRAQLLADRTEARAGETHPLCRECGTTMVPRTRSRRRLVLQGDQVLELDRSYVVCPSCGAGLFPPG